MEKREFSYTVCGNVNWYSYYGEQSRGSLKKLKIELSYDRPIPLSGIYSEKNLIWSYACTVIFTFYSSQYMEVKYMPFYRWMDKENVIHKYNRILLSHKIKEWNNSICSNMNGSGDHHTKQVRETKTNGMISLTCEI